MEDIPTVLSTQAALRCQTLAEAAQLPNEILLAFAANKFLFGLENQKPTELVCYYGHGTSESLVGNELLTADMLSETNADLIQGKILYAFACQSGNILAPALIRAGARSVFASLDYMWGAFPEDDRNYFEDWLDTILIIPRTLFKGGSTREALLAFKELNNEYIELYQSEPDKYYNGDYYLEAFTRNRDGMTLFGDADASLVSVSPASSSPFADAIRNLIHVLNSILPQDTKTEESEK